MVEKKLADTLIVTVKHSCPVKEGAEVWRVIVAFSDSGQLIKDYFVWATGEFLEDKEKLKADLLSAEKFAIEFAAKRYEESCRVVPKEGGVSCSVKEGVKFIDDAVNFIHPIEMGETKFN